MTGVCRAASSLSSLCESAFGGELFWIHLDLERIKLEVLVNQRALRGDSLSVGATLEAEVWLQGHVLDEHALRSRYEGR
jgi:hypothetical protein